MLALLNAFGFALLLTSLFVLRFRYWDRSGLVMVYFASFFVLEFVTSHYFIPEGAIGPGVGFICLGLTAPVWVAIFLVRRHEQRHARETP
jgi:hypothetical protein